MPKLVKNNYYNAKGEKKVCGYLISISKIIVEQAGFDITKQCEIKAENGKIVITQK